MSGQQIVLFRDGREQSFPVSDPERVLREVTKTQARPPWTLPVSWFEPHVAAAMSVWIMQDNLAAEAQQ
jgi:hypothetical protein